MEQQDNGIIEGTVDHRGQPAQRSSSGGWRSACFIIGVEMTERFAYYGIALNLITYLTGHMGQSTAAAAANVNVLAGTATLLPLLGAFVADSFLGRFRTIIAASVVYILEGTNPVSRPLEPISLIHKTQKKTRPKALSLTGGTLVYQLELSLHSLYRSTFKTTSAGLLGLESHVVYTIRKNEQNPFTRIFRVVGRAIKRNWQNTTPAIEFANEEGGSMSFQNSKQFKFLDKALLRPDGSMEDQNVCSIRDVEETKALLRLVPIWATGLAYAVVFAQTSTFFTKQGATMDRTFVSGLHIPAASLQSFIGVAIILFLPLYDCIFVPISRSVTGKHSGNSIPDLQHYLEALLRLVMTIGLLDNLNRARLDSFCLLLAVLGVEVAERSAYVGMSSNLITYLTGPLGQSTAGAAKSMNVWSGTSSLLPLLGAFIADSFLGRFKTIVVASFLYILGLAIMTLLAVLPFSSDSDYRSTNFVGSVSTSSLQMLLFLSALYVVALGHGGHKPCVQAFGADQFDGEDPQERKARSSFFNWWYFGMHAGMSVATVGLSYMEENFSWSLGFGIPCILMLGALVVFLLGTKSYRYSVRVEEKDPFVRIGRVFLATIRNWKTEPYIAVLQEETCGLALHHQSSEQFRFLNKALLLPDGSNMENEKVCSVSEVEEAKTVLRLVPIWTSCLVYGIVFAQSSTFLTKQGATMDRSITTNFEIPAASLQSLISVAIILFIPIYDRILVPTARVLTGKSSGITALQRIGTGMVLSILLLAVAALVETKRLVTAKEYGLMDKPNVTIPMSIWWLVPQYVLFGITDAFIMVPSELRSVGLALYLSIFGVGSFLSSFLISAVEKATGGVGHDNWFSDNLNRAHLDYFYWLLAVLSAAQLAAYLYCAKSYIYKN
ncbi:hypothetical protein Tsubulata_029079 [Turnera subulata]|uniref:Uncharacterized protein n=1 Tax=Turnera subulata TaxID=218843 RepID=A0A9Q0GGK3_9ROSI|nr:hypothetical protein Tsubulata_029079 [Turnera subulata]